MRATLQILASNADAFHSSGVALGPRLTRVELSATFDDYLNIHSRAQVVSGRKNGTNRLTILDPRLARDRGLPNDAPYGTVESFQHVRPGDGLSLYELSTLRPLALGVPVLRVARLTDAAAARAAAARMNAEVGAPPFNARPPLLPVDVCGLPAEPHCALRAWEVTLGGPALPPSVGKYTLVHIDGRDARGAVLEENHYHGGFDGIRWKSSGGSVTNSRLAVRYLEVTRPARSTTRLSSSVLQALRPQVKRVWMII